MRLAPTRARLLVLLAVVGTFLGWSLVRAVGAATGRIIGVPWLASLTLWALAIGLLLWTVGARSHPATARHPRAAALALAASRTGAVIGGLYLGIVLGVAGDLGVPSGVAAFAAAATAVVACVVLTGAALWLESLCRLRRDDGPDERRGPHSGGPR